MVESKKERSKASKRGWRTRERDSKSRTSYRTRVVERARSARRRVAKPKLIEMLLFGGAGYLAGNALNNTGVSGYLYQHNKFFKEFVDTGYSIAPNKFANGGGSGLMAVLGLGVGADAIYKSSKTGKLSGKALNMELPFAIGAILDPPKSNGSSGSDW